MRNFLPSFDSQDEKRWHQESSKLDEKNLNAFIFFVSFDCFIFSEEQVAGGCYMPESGSICKSGYYRGFGDMCCPHTGTEA